MLALAVGIVLVRPTIQMPRSRRFIDGSGPVFAGTIFPFCFITIACGAISGFHALISSGTTPKLLMREGDARIVGYGSMLMESFVGVMAMVAACALEPGVYFAINSPAGVVGATRPQAAAHDLRLGLPGRPRARCTSSPAAWASRRCSTAPAARRRSRWAWRTSSAARSAASGCSRIWYHFAIMFEALFILTVLDAGTRVGRFMVQELLGRCLEAARRTRLVVPASSLTSGVIVGAWGYFLYQGVLDPLGGINSPLAAVRHREPDPRRRSRWWWPPRS